MLCPDEESRYSGGPGLEEGGSLPEVAARVLAWGWCCSGEEVNKGAWDSSQNVGLRPFQNPPPPFRVPFVLLVVSLPLFCKVYF